MTVRQPLEDAVRELIESARDGVVPIVTVGEPVLRRPAEPLADRLERATLGRLVEVMRATMHDAPGVGLAAPQIGIPLRIAVIEDMYEVSREAAAERERTPVPFRVLVDPVYREIGTERRSFYEGCLSVPGYQAVVSRAADVELECTDQNGNAVDEVFHGWPARIVAHETDHLNGTVYIDKAITRSIAANGVYAELWADPSPRRAADALGFELATE
ncbi:peptide deformylase [Rhodococcoides yunnanense]|uniref:peptide deformylase n=1 Tax=Rhodococcoides yunnanense TaxID=278209 RepID=UPI000934C4FF|nr:peptide deformylase [Rhodococcus yunnanensis]